MIKDRDHNGQTTTFETYQVVFVYQNLVLVKNIFMYDRAKLWNSTPKDIRESKAISSFWNKIATHMINS